VWCEKPTASAVGGRDPLETTAAILRSVGYTVTEAQDREVALEELAQKPFDVVVLDERLPKLNGTEVVRTLSPVPPPPVIMMASAYDFDLDFQQSLGQRVFKYLKKPVPPKVLIEAVGEALDSQRDVVA
jgi:two-component system response regulator ChvI